MTQKVFVAATNNTGKVEEIRSVLSCLGYTVYSKEQAGIECFPVEDGKTFLENSLIKARAFKELTGFAVIADDSGLMVEALDGEPNIRTARYAGENCSDGDNINLLLRNLKTVKSGDRTAWFAAAVTAILPDNEVVTACGYIRGYIGTEKRGLNGFGYDPVFYTKGNLSFGEMSEERKNGISHRGRALRKLGFKLRKIKRMRRRG